MAEADQLIFQRAVAIPFMRCLYNVVVILVTKKKISQFSEKNINQNDCLTAFRQISQLFESLIFQPFILALCRYINMHTCAYGRRIFFSVSVVFILR